METSGAIGNRLLLRLRKATAMRQLKADHSFTVKATKFKMQWNITEVKQRRAWTRQEIREVIWCYMYCRQHFTENYKKIYEIWRQRNPERIMYMDAKKLMNQKNYIMKHNKTTEMEIEEIKMALQASQRSYLEEWEEEELEHPGTIRDGEQKPNAAFTTEEEMKIH